MSTKTDARHKLGGRKGGGGGARTTINFLQSIYNVISNHIRRREACVISFAGGIPQKNAFFAMTTFALKDLTRTHDLKLFLDLKMLVWLDGCAYQSLNTIGDLICVNC